MRRIGCMLLMLCLMLTGCSIQHEQSATPDSTIEKQEDPTPQPEPSPDQTPTPNKTPTANNKTETDTTTNTTNTTIPPMQTEQKAPPPGAFSPTYKGPTDRDARAFIYGDTAYYECDPYERDPWQDNIYTVPLGGKTATDLLKGELITLTGSVLIGLTETYFCAMDLTAATPKWVNLGPAATYITHLRQGDTLYLYVSLGEKYFADVIDLKTFQVERITAPANLRQVTAADNEIFYLTADGFYRGDPLKRSSILLDTATDGEQFHVVDNLVIAYQDGVLPRVYNCKTQTLTIPENIKTKVGAPTDPHGEHVCVTCNGYESPAYDNKFINGVVTVYYNGEHNQREHSFYYDFLHDCEIADIDSLYPDYTEGKAAIGGYYVENENTGQFDYYVNGKKYSTSKNFNRGGIITTLNEKGAAFLYQTAIYTVSFQTGQGVTIAHYEQAVTTE